jgi:glycosyltransferase involved in cell wall biosynthesis
MRIAYLIHQNPRGGLGGSEVYAGHLARAAVQAGHQALVVCRGDGRGQPVRRDEQDGVAYFTLDADSLWTSGGRFALRASYDNPVAFERVKRLLAEFRTERLHVHHFLMTSARLALSAAERGIPVTATLHDYWAFCHRITWQLPDDTACPGPQRGLRCRHCGKPEYNRFPGRLLQPAHAAAFFQRNALLRRAYGVMRGVFAPSQAVLDAHRANGFAEAALHLLPYGLPLGRRFERGAPRSPLRVGFIGRLAPEKGVETLIRAARQGHRFEAHIHGGGDPGYEAGLRRIAAGAPVVFHGAFAHAELHRVLDGLDVVALPSRWRENLPLTALEAAQRGVPVVAAALGGLREMPALCGVRLIEADASEAWAAALDELAGEAVWRSAQQGMRYERRIADDLAAHLEAGGRA